jgi:cytochrome b6-f complex iron-sulfur subunit
MISFASHIIVSLLLLTQSHASLSSLPIVAFASVKTTTTNTSTSTTTTNFKEEMTTTTAAATTIQQQQQQVFTRRNLLNLILTSATLSTIATTTPQPAQAFFGIPTKEGPKPAIASDITGTPILYQQFLSKHKPNERIMVQGLKSDPTYLIVSSDGTRLLNYALNAECTHLGCLVPWDSFQAKFVCPCHGSQYDRSGMVMRGPASGPLKLAKVGLEEESGKVLLEPWVEDDFRTGGKPWWA